MISDMGGMQRNYEMQVHIGGGIIWTGTDSTPPPPCGGNTERRRREVADWARRREHRDNGWV